MSSLLDDNLEVDFKSLIKNKLLNFCTSRNGYWGDGLSKYYIAGGWEIILIGLNEIDFDSDSLDNYYIAYVKIDYFNGKVNGGKVKFRCVKSGSGNYTITSLIRNRDSGVILTLKQLLENY